MDTYSFLKIYILTSRIKSKNVNHVCVYCFFTYLCLYVWQVSCTCLYTMLPVKHFVLFCYTNAIFCVLCLNCTVLSSITSSSITTITSTTKRVCNSNYNNEKCIIIVIICIIIFKKPKTIIRNKFRTYCKHKLQTNNRPKLTGPNRTAI